VRILVTNDDGVGAPGLAALTRRLVRHLGLEPAGTAQGRENDAPNELVVVAPSSNYSGASAAVGHVVDRMSIAFQRATVEGAEQVPAFGLDAPPALAVIAGALGAMGRRPDLVLSGINHGANVGRSVLHSGTVGAALTAGQLGISALAVSLRTGAEPDPWDTAAEIAAAIVPVLTRAPAGTVLNLNVPHVAPESVRGVRWARVGGGGLITSARGPLDGWRSPLAGELEGPAALEAAHSEMAGEPREKGEIVLTVGSSVPHRAEVGDALSDEDAVLVAQGYAALTALRSPRADDDPDRLAELDRGLAGAVAGFSFAP
jgi:5'-nucleotidase